MPWFGSPRAGQHWADAWTERMAALADAAELQRRKREAQTLGGTPAPQVPGARQAPQQKQPSAAAAISRVWAEYNVQQGNRTGLRLHTSFAVSRLLGRTGTVAVYFYQAGGLLEDRNGRYRSATGRVCAAAPFTPAHLHACYDDLALFLPYAELHLAPGTHELGWFIILWDDGGKKLGSSKGVPFTLRVQ